MEESSRKREIYQTTIIGSIGNFLLVTFKFVAGIAGNSAAMVADAVHSLSDFATDIIVLIFVKISSKPQDKGHHYGHGKYETIATAIIGLALLAVGVGIFRNGVCSIWHAAHGQQLSEPGYIAFIAAVVSIIVKELLYHYTIATGKRTQSQVVIANAWHHRSDALSSIGTAIGIGGAILLGEQWRILDPIAAIIVSIFIVKVAYSLVAKAFGELTEESLPDEIEQQILRILLESQEVSEPHNLRTRRIGNRSAIEVHVRMDGNMTVSHAHEITRTMERQLKELLGEYTYVNIHVEPRKATVAKE